VLPFWVRLRACSLFSASTGIARKKITAPGAQGKGCSN